MSPQTAQQLRGLTTFPAIFAYLRDTLGWPLAPDNIDEEDITFDYTPEELGLNKQYAIRITRIRQLRELQQDQPWAVFYIEFENKQLPVTVMRNILKKLTTAREDRRGWDMEDLLFITVQGTNTSRSVAFSHFRKAKDGRLPELRSFSWDGGETHFYYIQRLNLHNLRWQGRGESVEAWSQRWRDAFISRPSVTISESRQLASEMARYARFMRDTILETYAVENQQGTWNRLMERVKSELIDNISTREFADVIAQTITYGLFSAAEHNHHFSLSDLADAIPPTNPFLRDLLRTLVDDQHIDLIELGIDRLISLYREANVTEIAHQFMRRTASGREDPVILFYEQFLNEYDREQRVERGVFYTPDPVVHYIVNSVDAILKQEFDISDGLASAEKYADGEHQVQILDPATGTGTFLAHIIDRVASAKNPSGKPSPEWNRYVAEDLLPRLNGFELMMAPYAIAHMKLGLKLEQTGYQFTSDQRLNVFLTNALERPQQQKLSSDFLARESDAAFAIKDQKKIMVVIGNPPYSGHSANDSKYITDLLRGKLPNGEPGANYFEVDGQPLNERNPKWLNDDYVKFIRMGQQRIEDTGHGVLAFITNHGYLDNPTFRGMRQSLMNTFDAIYVLDLHGNSKKKETTPEGNKDENEFDIMQGVSIGLFIKGGKSKGVFRGDLWGVRPDKYRALMDNMPSHQEFSALDVHQPFYLFVPQDQFVRDEYQQYFSIPSVYQTNSVGIVTGQDSKTIAQTEVEAQVLAESHDINNDAIRSILYRPFDNRFVVYHNSIITRSRIDVMRHMIIGDNLGLISSRGLEIDRPYDQILPTSKIIQLHTLSIKEGNYLYPVYLYPNENELLSPSEWELSDKGRRPNLDKTFVDTFAGKLDLTFITDGRGDLTHTFGPEDIFHYAYAIFHSPMYRTRYAEFLKIDFPRLPLTDNLLLFNQLAQRGADLVALHLLEDDYPASSWVLDGDDSPLAETGVTFVEGKDGTTVGKFGNNNYDAKNERVYLSSGMKPDTSYFEGIPQNVWAFQIGGYQVLHKWLYDRRGTGKDVGRTLTADDINHYKRIVASLHHTITLMDEIDKIIDDQGGYPIAGSQVMDEEKPMTNYEIPDDEEIEIAYEELVDGTEAEDTGNDQMEPFNPDDIMIDTRPFTLDLILKRIRRSGNENEKVVDGINLSPAFQRKAGIWDTRKQSRLIESIFLRIPLPVFYIAEDPEISNHWIVVDGLQRLTTLKRFVIDKTLKLRDLEFWGEELNGKTWDSIPDSLKTRLEETQVLVHLIQRRTPEQVRFNVFKRINTGGVPLSSQEIRHALNQGPVTIFLEQLAQTEEFLEATDGGVNPSRQADRECILRFISFKLVSYRHYSDRNNLDIFFNNTMKELNKPENVARYPEIEASLKRSMKAARAIFDNTAFRKTLPNGRRSIISKPLFEAWSVVLANCSDDELATLVKRRKYLIHEYKLLQHKDPVFQRAISYSTGNTKQVHDRFSMIEDLVQKVLEAKQ